VPVDAQTAPAVQVVGTGGSFPGTTVTAAGEGFPVRSTVRITFAGMDAGSANVDAGGRWTAAVDIPAVAAGVVDVEAKARNVRARTTFTVLEPHTADGTGLQLGVSVEGAPWSLADLDAFEADVGARAGLVMYYQDWAHSPSFEPGLVDPILDRGHEAMLTWEPWDYTGPAEQEMYRLARILDGTHDAHIRRWAEGIAAWGRPLQLRFAHEMNGSWYPWSEQLNENRSGEYVSAWRHVRHIFDAAGATNVTWVWSPSADSDGYTAHAPVEGLYPGDDVVDVIGLDGYNWGTTQDWGSWWQLPDQIFDTTLARVTALADKPVIIAETATTEVGGDKAAWIGALFTWLDSHPEVEGVTWFDHDKETDWRVRSSPASSAAFTQALTERGLR
jgi:hypothetical protein